MTNNHSVAHLGQFIEGLPLGEGAFGSVIEATHVATQTKVAVKKVSKVMDHESISALSVQSEMELAMLCANNHVVKTYGLLETADHHLVVMEHCSNGTMSDWLRRNLYGVGESVAAVLVYQILLGINALHSKNVAWLDCKPENIMFKKNGKLGISDFGLAAAFKNKDTAHVWGAGSLMFMPPEYVNKDARKNPFKGDIFSLGATFYDILFGPQASKHCQVFNPNISPRQPKLPWLAHSARHAGLPAA